MSRDDEECLKLGREVVRMIRSLEKTTGGETGYSRRTITFPNGAVDLFIANDRTLARVFDAAAENHYKVQTVTPPSERN